MTALILISVVVLTGCPRKTPDLNAIFAQTKLRRGKRPVIIIPGILGSEMVNSKTGERVWLNFSTAKTDGLSLPISPDLTKNHDDLIPKGIIQKAKISAFLPDVYVYQALIDAMRNFGGYTAGDWENPDLECGGIDKYYVFAYDWRLDNVENSRLLVHKIEELKAKLGKPDLKFNVIAHSMGGLIARYAAMYADADLPANGETPVPDWRGANHFSKIFMFGTPNEGSMATLEAMLKGYRIGGFLIRNLNPESMITSPAVFQLLPHNGTARFYDGNLQPLEIDLYNAETWKKYGWSAYTNKDFLDKFKGQPNAVDENGRKSEFADVSLSDLDAYFRSVLNRARNFQNALDVDAAAPASLSLFAFGSDCDETQDGAVLVKNSQKGWQTIFSPKKITNADGKTFSQTAVKEKLFAPGDSRVTRRSLLAETVAAKNFERFGVHRNLPNFTSFACETHNDLTNSKIIQDNFLTALMNEIVQ